MEQGWIKLYRKILDSAVFSDPILLKLWCYCLLKASYKENWVSIPAINNPIKILPGQFITGRNSLWKEFYPTQSQKYHSLSPLTLWRKLKTLQNMQNLNIKSTNKFSIITIINWEEHQSDEQQTNSRRTADEQQTNTNKKDKKDKNIKNKEKNTKKRKCGLPENFNLTEKLKNYALENSIDSNQVEKLFENFCNYHIAHGTVMADWDRAWYTFVKNAPRFSPWAVIQEEDDSWKPSKDPRYKNLK